MHKVLFTVGLSNGETVYEERGNFKRLSGALSPWERLKSYIQDNSLEITSLSLYKADGTRWNLQSAGGSPRFHAFADGAKPSGYSFFRRAGIDKNPNTGETISSEVFAVVEAIYESYSVQLWVNDETGNSWILVTDNQ